MAEKERTYTIEEIEQETGYSRRTISYYVRIGLLPKVGQRGPKTRYSRIFLERLLFLKELRRQQETGKFPPLSLEEIRDRILRRLPHEVIGLVARGEEDLVMMMTGGGVGEVEGRWLDADESAPSLASEAIGPETIMGGEWAHHSITASDLKRTEAELGELLSRLGEELPQETEKRGAEGGEWTTVEVTEDVLLTVRLKNRRVVKIVGQIGRLMRGLIARQD